MTASTRTDARSFAFAAGGMCWLLTIGYFAAQLVVAAAWVDTAYSFTENTISDLGNTLCGEFVIPDGASRYVCSPRHALMNAAFVAVGALTAVGAMLTWRWWPRRAAATVGLSCLVASGVGGVLVGLGPADVNLTLHAIGALLQVPGAVGMLMLGLAVARTHGRAGAFSVICGIIATAACLLFLARVHLGLGVGGMERAAFDTLTVWTVVLGVVILRRAARAAPAQL